MPSVHPANENVPNTVNTITTKLVVARIATTALPVNANTDVTAKAVLISIEVTTPSTAAFSVAILMNIGPVIWRLGKVYELPNTNRSSSYFLSCKKVIQFA
jgi:hypothetical protein